MWHCLYVIQNIGRNNLYGREISDKCFFFVGVSSPLRILLSTSIGLMKN